MLRHTLGRAVIFLSLQHVISPSLNLILCLCVCLVVFIACLLSRRRREAIRAVTEKERRQEGKIIYKHLGS